MQNLLTMKNKRLQKKNNKREKFPQKSIKLFSQPCKVFCLFSLYFLFFCWHKCCTAESATSFHYGKLQRIHKFSIYVKLNIFRVNWEEKYGESKANEIEAASNFFDPLWWTTDKFIYFYAGGIVALMFAMVSGAFAFYRMCLRASMNLHDKIFTGIIRSQMVFFYMNTTGRILNRFSKDIGVIDSQLPVVVIDCIKVWKKLN